MTGFHCAFSANFDLVNFEEDGMCSDDGVEDFISSRKNEKYKVH